MKPTLARPELLLSTQLIDGRWQASLGGASYPVNNPADDTRLCMVADSGPQDAALAVEAAQKAFETWKQTPLAQRKTILRNWHQLILQHQQDLALIITLEQGKPLAEALGEVRYGASYIDWFTEEASRVYGEIIPDPSAGRHLSTRKEPVGVVAAITPWNFPMAMLARKIAPALAVGCTVVVKPAEDTPLTALAMVKLAEEAGVPPGVLNIITASRQQAAATVKVWLDDFRVRKLTFTGSTAVGKHLAQASAATLKKLSLELGGNAPFIVFDDADLDAAVDGLMAAKFRNGGQTCVCPNRVYVQQGIAAAFAAALSQRVSALRIGPGWEPESQIGPMINAAAIAKIELHVSDAIQLGGEILTGGRRYRTPEPASALYFEPTVIANASPSMRLAHEETFGPVVPLFGFETEAEVIAAANATEFGLAAYFYTRDIKRIHRMSSALEAGIIGINEGAVASEAAPFGGIKASGYGREGSRYGLDDYLQIKYLCQGNL
jgi:succinate-semialdehyde dehydrogenase/glutarate-semialdehyde dehydrogenase